MAVWFVTGASRGFGRLLTRELLRRGHDVIATGRNLASIVEQFSDFAEQVLPLRLDVRDHGQVEAAMRAGVSRFGRIDVLLNNAGYGLFGSIEETTDAQVRELFDTNVFGLLTVTRAVLPIMRAQRSGHVIMMSSSAGFAVGAGRGLYGASKFAVEALSEALQKELAPLGVKVTVVEPGSFRTEFLSSGSRRTVPVSIDDYTDTVGSLIAAIDAGNGRQPGDPARAVAAILQIASSTEPPVRLQLGSDSVAVVEEKVRAVSDSLDRWRDLAVSTDFSDPSDSLLPAGRSARD